MATQTIYQDSPIGAPARKGVWQRLAGIWSAITYALKPYFGPSASIESLHPRYQNSLSLRAKLERDAYLLGVRQL
jgi:hypothetical protein